MRLSLRYLGIAVTLLSVAVSSASAQSRYTRGPEAEAAYRAGLEHFGQENWEAALAAFSAAVQADDTDTEALVGRGDSLRELEDYSNAQQSYMSALLINDQLARAHYGQGVCFRESGDINSAFASFNNAADIDRNDPEIAADLGGLLVNSTEDVISAMRYLDMAIELDPANAIAFRNRAIAHARLGEADEAIADLEKAIEVDPTDYEAHDTLARIQIAEEEFELAIDAYAKAIEVYEPEESSDPSLFLNGYLERAGVALLLAVENDTSAERRQELYDMVITDTEKVLEEYPDRMPESGYAFYRQGQALRLQKRYGEAIKTFTEAIQMVPGGRDGPYIADAYLKRGICWHYQGQDSLARPDFEQAASIRFEDPLPHLWLGYSYAQEEDYWQAIENYGDAIAKTPAFALAHVNRGLAYMQLGEYKKAVDNFNEAIRHEPTNPEHYYKRGIAHLKREEFQKALDSYDLAILYDESSAKAHRGAAVALRGLDRDSLAVQHENLARELDQ